MHESRLEECISKFLADIIARIIYLIMGFFTPIVFFTLTMSRGISIWHVSPHNAMNRVLALVLGISVISAVLFALLGPSIYKRVSQRGRGNLQEIREASRPRF